MYLQKDKLLIPGKTFVIGEYSALEGGAAIVFAHNPCFEATLSQDKTFFHPDSPAGKILKSENVSPQFIFNNPYLKGGFGGSTAEFLAAYVFAKHNFSTLNINLKEVLNEYLHLFAGKKIKPSGYDLISQFNGGFCAIKNANVLFTKNIFLKTYKILLFTTQQKVTTHDHLEKIESSDFKSLADISELIVNFWDQNNEESMLEGVNEFSKCLDYLGLVDEDTKNKLRFVKKIEGVKAAKGCGAMGADTILLIINNEYKNKIIEECEKINLKFLVSCDQVYMPEVSL